MACWDAVSWYEGPLCPACGARLPTGVQCRCVDRPAHVTSLACAADYDGPMRAIIHGFKYARHQSLAAPLAWRLRAHPHLALDRNDLVVPVPLHPWRRIVRGFNQAEHLARHLERPLLHALARWQWTPPQAGLSAPARRRNVRGAIRLAPRLTANGSRRLRAQVAGARVLVVDDVVTTGETMSACARVLREAGAREVRAAAVARTPLAYKPTAYSLR